MYWRGHSQPVRELGPGTGDTAPSSPAAQGQHYPGPDTTEDRNHIICRLSTSQGEVTKKRIMSH